MRDRKVRLNATINYRLAIDRIISPHTINKPVPRRSNRIFLIFFQCLHLDIVQIFGNIFFYCVLDSSEDLDDLSREMTLDGFDSKSCSPAASESVTLDPSSVFVKSLPKAL